MDEDADRKNGGRTTSRKLFKPHFDEIFAFTCAVVESSAIDFNSVRLGAVSSRESFVR